MELYSEENIDLKRGDLRDEMTQDTEKYTQNTLNTQTDTNPESFRKPLIIKIGQSGFQDFLKPTAIKKRNFSLKDKFKRSSLSEAVGVGI